MLFFEQIGTLAGNLMMKYQFNDFPSDVFLLLESAGATLSIGELRITAFVVCNAAII